MNTKIKFYVFLFCLLNMLSNSCFSQAPTSTPITSQPICTEVRYFSDSCRICFHSDSFLAVENCDSFIEDDGQTSQCYSFDPGSGGRGVVFTACTATSNQRSEQCNLHCPGRGCLDMYDDNDDLTSTECFPMTLLNGWRNISESSGQVCVQKNFSSSNVGCVRSEFSCNSDCSIIQGLCNHNYPADGHSAQSEFQLCMGPVVNCLQCSNPDSSSSGNQLISIVAGTTVSGIILLSAAIAITVISGLGYYYYRKHTGGGSSTSPSPPPYVPSAPPLEAKTPF